MIFVHPASGDFQEGTDLRWEKRLVALVIREAIFIPKSQEHGFPNMELLSEGAIIFKKYDSLIRQTVFPIDM